MIPARYGSVRLPGKPLLLINGKPLIQHVYARAQESAAVDIVIVTDDIRIKEIATGFDAKVCMTSTKHQSGSDRIAEALQLLNWSDDVCVVNLQGDEPCMPATLINQVAQNLQTHEAAAMATLAARIDTWELIHNHNVVKVVVDAAGYALYFSRAPIPWYRNEFSIDKEQINASLPDHINIYRHIGLYAYRAKFLRQYVNWPSVDIERAECLEQLRVIWHGERIHVGTATTTSGPGVDTLEDIAKVEAILSVQ